MPSWLELGVCSDMHTSTMCAHIGNTHVHIYDVLKGSKVPGNSELQSPKRAPGPIFSFSFGETEA